MSEVNQTPEKLYCSYCGGLIEFRKKEIKSYRFDPSTGKKRPSRFIMFGGCTKFIPFDTYWLHDAYKMNENGKIEKYDWPVTIAE